MSSLAAARADGYYYPPDFDGNKHGTLNKYNGQHALRDRARKLDQGILIIRFEVPFNIWCDGCGEHIAKGVRFNAEKKQVGQYFSTKILAFTMRHHCGCKITIQTDPKNAEYEVTAGARRKVETYEAEDAQTIEVPDADELAKVNADPLSRLERTTEHAARAAAGRQQLTALLTEAEERHRDDYAMNKAMRARMRATKRDDAALEQRREALGLPPEIRLLPEAPADEQVARLALFAARDRKFSANQEAKRRKLLSDDIFAAASPAPVGRAGSATGASTSGRASAVQGLGPRTGAKPPPAGAKRVTIGSASGAGGASAHSKQQQLAALLAASRKRGLQKAAASQPVLQRKTVVVSHQKT